MGENNRNKVKRNLDYFSGYITPLGWKRSSSSLSLPKDSTCPPGDRRKGEGLGEKGIKADPSGVGFTKGGCLGEELASKVLTLSTSSSLDKLWKPRKEDPEGDSVGASLSKRARS